MSETPTSIPRSESNWFAGRGLPLMALVLASVIVVCVPATFGVDALPSLAVLGLTSVLALLLVLLRAPSILVVITTALVPLPLVLKVFPYELALLLLAVAVVVVSWRQSEPWLCRMRAPEIACLALLAWAAFTGFWCSDDVHYLLGVRRLAFGFLAFWTAYRVARLAPRGVFEMSLPALAIALTLTTLVHWLRAGVSGMNAVVHRATATDLGWGWANYIAALLLIVTPVLMLLARHGSTRLVRLASWPALLLITASQGLIVARGALILFLGGVLAQLAVTYRRRRLLGVSIAIFSIATLFLGPWGEGILFRFTNLRELSSMTIRIWYFREAWRRTLDNLPWGMGLGQGWTYADKLQTLDPHNYWLALSSELGIPGVLLWLAVLILIWRGLSRLAHDPERRIQAHTLQIVFVLSQVHSLIEPTFQGNQYQFLFFWMMGGLTGYIGFADLGQAVPKPFAGTAPALESPPRSAR